MGLWRRALVMLTCAGLLVACNSPGGGTLRPAKVEIPPGSGGQPSATPGGADQSMKVDLEGTGHPAKIVGAIDKWANTLQVAAEDGRVLLDLAWDTNHFSRVVGIGAPTRALWVSDELRLDGSTNMVYLFDPLKDKLTALTWSNPTPYGSEQERPTELRGQCTGRENLRELQCSFPLEDMAKHTVAVSFRYDLGKLVGTRTGARLTFGTLAREPAAPAELFKMFFTALSLRVEGEVPTYFLRPEEGRQIYATAAGVPMDQVPEIALQVKAVNTYMFTARWPRGGPPSTGTAVISNARGQWRFESFQWAL